MEGGMGRSRGKNLLTRLKGKRKRERGSVMGRNETMSFIVTGRSSTKHANGILIQKEEALITMRMRCHKNKWLFSKKDIRYRLVLLHSIGTEFGLDQTGTEPASYEHCATGWGLARYDFSTSPGLSLYLGLERFLTNIEESIQSHCESGDARWGGFHHIVDGEEARLQSEKEQQFDVVVRRKKIETS